MMVTTPALDATQAILDFWFLPAGHLHNGYRHEWFREDAAFDAEIRALFSGQIEAALTGQATEWNTTPDGVLARILLLDQFPRKIYCNTAQAFAGDAQALAISTHLVASGRDKNLPPIRRWFAFMPFMHSEAIIDQERSMALCAGLRREAQHEIFDAAYDYAEHHRAIIERFGRFPQRNALLGRGSTDAELKWLEYSECHR